MGRFEYFYSVTLSLRHRRYK